MVEGGDQAESGRVVPAETAALRELTGRGILTSAWTPGHPGAVLMVDLPDATGATQLVTRLPLAQAGLITNEIIPLHPMEL